MSFKARIPALFFARFDERSDVEYTLGVKAFFNGVHSVLTYLWIHLSRFLLHFDIKLFCFAL